MQVMCIKDGKDLATETSEVHCGNDYTVIKECDEGTELHHYHIAGFVIPSDCFDPKLFAQIKSEVDEKLFIREFIKEPV